MMKKLITVTLILALLLPAAALAEDPDPIVGAWYLYFDSNVMPEFVQNFGYDFVVCVYLFMKDGTILTTETDILNGSSQPMFGAAGKWSKEAKDYKYSIVGLGEGKLFIDDERINLQLNATNTYMQLRKLYPFNPYQDYLYSVAR